METKSFGSFKIHKKGRDGISVTSKQLTKAINDLSGKTTYQDEVSTMRKEEVPVDILKGMEQLKFFFLNMTGHWIPLYDKYLNEETNLLNPITGDEKPGREILQKLWDITTVTQVRVEKDSFCIYGMMQVFDGAPLVLNPPKVTIGSEVDFYQDARTVIEKIVSMIASYFMTIPLEDINDIRRYVLEHVPESRKEEIAKFSDTEIMNYYMDKVHDLGGVVLNADNIAIDAYKQSEEQDGWEESSEINETPVAEEFEDVPNTDPLEKTIEDILQDESEISEGESWEPPVEKVKEPFGLPAAEDKAAEPASDDMQYSNAAGGVADMPADNDLPDEDFDVV